MRTLALAVCTAALAVPTSSAQQPQRKEPVTYSAPARASRVEARPPGIRLNLRKPKEFSLAPLSASETARLTAPETRMKTGVHRSVPPAALATGAWETMPDGSPVWRMALRSPGSEGIRLEFRNFSVGDGKVWVHDGTNSVGPYTGRGLYGDGHFWSASVAAESVILEYEPAVDGPRDSAPPFTIATLSHQARPKPSHGAALLPVPDAGTADPADYCHLDPNCYPEWRPAMSMVGQLTFEDSGIEYLCSGSLVATRDNSMKPYLLTAGHCIHSEDTARSLEVYWTYQTASCGAPPPASRDSSTKSTLGAHLIGASPIDQGDYSLVLLQDIPANVTFSGWDPGDPPLGTPLTGIHHPAGSWKRISFGQRVNDATVDVEGATAPGNLFLETLWDKGRTEPGSSGSPLFSSPGVIVGTLTYGPSAPGLSACQITPSIDGYGRFSNIYQALKDYFEDLPAALITPGTPSLTYAVTNHAAPAAQTVQLTTQSPGTIAYKLRADAPWINLSALTGTLSAKSAAQVSITVDPSQLTQLGQAQSTVTILSGAAPPQFINVTANVQVSQSNVTAAVSPDPVYQSGGQWTFQIRLSETAGAATRLTGMKINGTDYSANIASWFGGNHIDANGAIATQLQGAGFVQGDQYFEFWGVDDASGQQWYRVVSASFR